MYILVTCCKLNTGKIYLENTNINAKIVKNEKDNWFKKKNGINCGISNLLLIFAVACSV